MRPVLCVALMLAAAGLTACANMDTSRMGEHVVRTQCEAEAGRYPGAMEDCAGVGSGRPNLAQP